MPVDAPQPARAARVVPLPTLRVVSGPATGTTLSLAETDGTIGRRPDNAYVVADPSVSRVHARITRHDDGSVRISDLVSSAGVRLNGQPCVGAHTLAHGDRLELGTCQCVVDHPVGRSTADEEDEVTTVAMPVHDEPAGVSLSPRQAEVLALIAEGLTNNEIGTRLGITERTVKAYAQELYTKLGVRNRASAVAEAIDAGLL